MSTALCRLYLSLDPDCPLAVSADALAAVLDAADIACILLRSGADRAVLAERARRIIAVAEARDIAVVIEDDAAFALEAGADGVHLSGGPAGYDEARALLGADAIVGVDAGGSRHQAMEAGEKGADYVAIPAGDADMVAWWTSIFQVPCVARTGGDLDAARQAVERAAEFVELDGSGWTDERTAIAGVTEMSRLVEDIGCELAQ
jgi:thiamine-phosphate pyrophosphorylase